MKFGTSITVTVAVLLASALGAWLAVSCARRDGIAVGKRLEHDAGTDQVNAARAQALDSSDVAWQHRLAILARADGVVSRALPAQRRRADSLEAVLAAVPDSFFRRAQVEETVQAKDSALSLALDVIDQDSVGIRERDGRILELLYAVHLYADSIVPSLARDRDWWKRRATSPCGLGGTVGLGVRGADAVAGFTCRVALPFLH